VHEALARVNFDRDVAGFSDVAAERFGLFIHSRAFPVLDATIRHTKPLRVRLRGDDWDDLPPSIELLNPDGTPWSSAVPGGVFHPGPHPDTHRPFICMRGSREFHTFPGHVNEKWEQYRGQDGMGLAGILVQLAVAWRKAVQ
jgi:hypothetical protein